MAETEEVLPSIKDLEKGGIALKINQSDIIDLIASSKVQELQFEIESFIKEGMEINKEYHHKKDEIFQKEKHKFSELIQKSYKNTGLIVKIGSISFKGYYAENSIDRAWVRNNSTASQFRFEKMTEKFRITDTLEIQFTVSVKLDGKTQTIDCSGKHLVFDVQIIDDELMEKIVDYNSRVEEFMMKYNNFNHTMIKKSIKAEFTKKILENSPEEFKKSLMENFNIAI